MLPAIAWIVGCAIVGGLAGGVAGAAIGAAWELLFMTDEDTAATAKWLRENSHPRLLNGFVFLVKVRKKVRRQFGIRVSTDPDYVQIVREESFSFDELPDDLKEALRNEDVTFDASKELKQALAS